MPLMKRLISQHKVFYTDTALYRRLRNQVIKEIWATKVQCFPSKIHYLKVANNKQWFSQIRSLCGLQKHSSGFLYTSQLPANTLAEEINSHFASICQTFPPLSTNFLRLSPSLSPPPLSMRLMSLNCENPNNTDMPHQVTFPKSSTEFAPEPAIPLCSIICDSISQNSRPSDWKISYMMPLTKTPKPSVFQ